MNTHKNERQAQSKKEKADWLVALEEQSWQAELLVSSIAIFGTLQLPGLITLLIDFLLLHLPRDMMGWLPFFICYYLIISSVGLAILFIYHFIVRSFWIGILGLISAYPEGIKYSRAMYSDYMIAKLRQHYPDIDTYNQVLDHRCSTIFASAFLFASFTLGTTVISVALLFITYLLAKVLPYEAQTISIAIGLSLFIVIMLHSLLNTKRLRNIAWLKRPHYLIAMTGGLLSYTVFWRSAGYISLMFRTHNDIKANMVSQLIMMVTVIAVAFPIIGSSNMDLFMDDKYIRVRADSNTLYEDAYADQRDDRYTLFPTIPSYEINTKHLRVFIPELAREQSALNLIAPAYEADSELSRRAITAARVSHQLERIAKFHSFFINETKIDDIRYFYQRKKNQQKGVVVLIDSKYFIDGNNALMIEKAFNNSDDEPMQIHINFIYTRP